MFHTFAASKSKSFGGFIVHPLKNRLQEVGCILVNRFRMYKTGRMVSSKLLPIILHLRLLFHVIVDAGVLLRSSIYAINKNVPRTCLCR